MKKLVNFIILVASIVWFVVLLILAINQQLNTNITPQFTDFFNFSKQYGALIILGTYVFFNTIGRGFVRILFGILILLLLAGVAIMIIKPELLSQVVTTFPAA
ncbi:MAG: hypothetical protein WCR30_01325 [Clostridia bacterium]